MILLTVDRVEASGTIEPAYATHLIAPATRASFAVEGRFAGWLEADR